jgi:hypothetical protein
MTTTLSIGDPSVFYNDVVTTTGNAAGTIVVSADYTTWESPYPNETKELKERLEVIEKRLMIIHPDKELHEKYPALKEAYEAYRIVERLIK